MQPLGINNYSHIKNINAMSELRRRYTDDSDFFMEGNVSRFDCFQTKYCPEWSRGELLPPDITEDLTNSIICSEIGCKQTFNSISKVL
jgi:hypothetical protein